ncbi:MAG: folylpolyglutamate synthase/dihydrofolate synthase family protein [Novosphingobium sp.]
MPDFAKTDSPQVQAQLDRHADLSLPQGRFGLEAITALLARLGDPHKRLPPQFHVAGTNGKGSTCAYLRAMLEAQGLTVHATTSPHLVRYNERIRIAGKLVEDAELAALLGEVLDAADGIEISFFEATIAASFLAFARHPADACVIEVGLGGRFDATNVLERPAACGIATLGIDHEAFLLAPEAGVPQEPLARIAFEKASIAKRGVPLMTQKYPREAASAVAQTARVHGAELFMRGQAWQASASDILEYADGFGPLALPLPALPGAHQADNAALAVAMLRHQDRVKVSPEAMAQGIVSARWSGRLHRLADGPLTRAAPNVAEVWLDGGHNPDAAEALARFFEVNSQAHPAATRRQSRQVSLPSRLREGLGVGQSRDLHLILGMLANKDAEAFIARLAPVAASLVAVAIPGHDHHAPARLAELARKVGVSAVGTAPDVVTALSVAGTRGRAGGALPRALIAGSLYLAGDVLRQNGELPD